MRGRRQSLGAAVIPRLLCGAVVPPLAIRRLLFYGHEGVAVEGAPATVEQLAIAAGRA